MGSLIPRLHIHPGNEATTAHLESCKGPISIKGSQIKQHLPKLKRKQERTTEREWGKVWVLLLQSVHWSYQFFAKLCSHWGKLPVITLRGSGRQGRREKEGARGGGKEEGGGGGREAGEERGGRGIVVYIKCTQGNPTYAHRHTDSPWSCRVAFAVSLLLTKSVVGTMGLPARP